MSTFFIYVFAFILSIVIGLAVACVAAWVFTYTPLGWTYWQYVALAIGINIASWQFNSK